MGRLLVDLKSKLLLSLIYLNTIYVLNILVIEYFLVEQHLFESENLEAFYVYFRAVFFLVLPVGFGYLTDYFGNHSLTLLKKYSKGYKFLLIVLLGFAVFLTEYAYLELSLAIVVVLLLVMNLLYLPINALLSYYWRIKQLPVLLLVFAISIYPVFVFDWLIIEFFELVGIYVSVVISVGLLFHAVYVFRRSIVAFLIKHRTAVVVSPIESVTNWFKLTWLAIILGFANAALFSIYPKIYLMLNEPHGVSYSDAFQFRAWLFFVMLLFLMPCSWLVQRYGSLFLLKFNNHLLLVSVACAIVFPNLFTLFSVVTAISLAMAIVSNLTNVFYHLSQKQRGVGVGLFFGITLFLVLLTSKFF